MKQMFLKVLKNKKIQNIVGLCLFIGWIAFVVFLGNTRQAKADDIESHVSHCHSVSMISYDANINSRLGISSEEHLKITDDPEYRFAISSAYYDRVVFDRQPDRSYLIEFKHCMKRQNKD